MGKNITKNLVGHSIFKQVMKILPREQFDLLVNKCGTFEPVKRQHVGLRKGK